MKRKYSKLIVLLVVVLVIVLALDAYGKWKTSQQQQSQSQQMIDIVVVPDDPGGGGVSGGSTDLPITTGSAVSGETGGQGSESPGPNEIEPDSGEDSPSVEAAKLPEDGWYDSKEEVALYIHQYGHLPSNYITKKQAQELGWKSGSLEKYAPGCSIGGSRFGNYNGLLPEKKGRFYTECDIDTAGKSKRGAKRIVFSNDGLIYYTDDHYESFELLYGEE